MNTKICSCCKNVLLLSEFYKDRTRKDGLYNYCKKCHCEKSVAWTSRHRNKSRQYVKKWREQQKKNNPDAYAKKLKIYHLNRYGITTDDWQQMFEKQKGCCVLCNKHQTNLKTPLHVDHCHKTGKVRGLLCKHCNTVLGWYEGKKNIIKNYLGE